ncbi:MAG: hypothetical protein H0V29_06180, partial [Thermoleophilaceae bacterium]|nr:hypothetical protein [Thermoleophilaceae bacterium]
MTEGERWARDRLAELERAGFAPRAIADFLMASQRRANETRRERPDLARQARRWTAVGAAAYAFTSPPRKPALAAWAAVALMLDWHLGMVETEDGEPRPLGPADAATLARAWFIPFAARAPTPALIAAAAATDVLDGRLARASAPTRA